MSLPHATPPTTGAAGLLAELEAEASGAAAPMPTPWASLNYAIAGGLRPGRLTVLAGSAGAAKSYLAFRLALHLIDAGAAVRVLPLEDAHADWLRRCIALRVNDWRVITDPGACTDALRAELAWASKIGSAICENPRMPVALADGSRTVLPVDFASVLGWAREMIPAHRLLVVDPLCQIEGDDRSRTPEHAQLNRFLQALLGELAGTRCHVLLCAHIVKRAGKDRDRPLCLDDLQGSAALSRLAHTVLFLDRYSEPMEHSVLTVGGAQLRKSHSMTLTIAKARVGRGVGSRIACDFDGGPRIVDLGVIVPEAK